MLRLFPLIFLLCLPCWGGAHDNHSMGKVAVEITRATHRERRIDVEAKLYLNGGQTAQLNGISVAGGQVINLPFPLTLERDSHGARNGHIAVNFTIEFYDTAPHIFSAMFNFGPQGVGPVLIIPDQKTKGPS